MVGCDNMLYSLQSSAVNAVFFFPLQLEIYSPIRQLYANHYGNNTMLPNSISVTECIVYMCVNVCVCVMILR